MLLKKYFISTSGIKTKCFSCTWYGFLTTKLKTRDLVLVFPNGSVLRRKKNNSVLSYIFKTVAIGQNGTVIDNFTMRFDNPNLAVDAIQDFVHSNSLYQIKDMGIVSFQVNCNGVVVYCKDVPQQILMQQQNEKLILPIPLQITNSYILKKRYNTKEVTEQLDNLYYVTNICVDSWYFSEVYVKGLYLYSLNRKHIQTLFISRHKGFLIDKFIHTISHTQTQP